MASVRGVAGAPGAARAGGLAREFRDFILRGNVVDLAVGIIIGAAFGTVVSALVKDLITPLLAAIGGQPNFGLLHFTLNRSTFLYGDFLNAVISFVIIAAVVFFFVVKPVNGLLARFHPTPEEPTPTQPCPYCKSSIALDASRCAFCTAELPALGTATPA